MNERSDQILDHIESQRNEFGANMNTLESRVRNSAADWRSHFDNNPMLMLSAALGGGILIGALVSNTRTRSGSYSSYSGSSTSSRLADYPSGTAASSVSVHRQRMAETLDQVKGALVAFGIMKAKEFLTHSLPGFDGFLKDTEPKSGHSDTSHRQNAYGEQSPRTNEGSYGSGSYGSSGSGSYDPSGYGQQTGRQFTGGDYGTPGGYRSSPPDRERDYNRERDQYNTPR